MRLLATVLKIMKTRLQIVLNHKETNEMLVISIPISDLGQLPHGVEVRINGGVECRSFAAE